MGKQKIFAPPVDSIERSAMSHLTELVSNPNCQKIMQKIFSFLHPVTDLRSFMRVSDAFRSSVETYWSRYLSRRVCGNCWDLQLFLFGAYIQDRDVVLFVREGIF